MLDAATLLRATAANHRAWFRRTAAVAGGSVKRLDGLDVVVAGAHGTIAFPRRRGRSPQALDEAMRLGLRSMSCWSLHDDDALGALLVARGFEVGWQPHWMALDLAYLPDKEPARPVLAARADEGRDLPYAHSGPDPRGVHHLAVVEDGRTIGHVVVNPWRGHAGIYDMGVARDRRRRGVGRALTIAACRLARDLGCASALLNATGEGEALYRTVGFRSLGWGRTWWLHPR